MDSFPAFIPLANARVVVVGDGEAAAVKARLFEGSPAQAVRLSLAEALAPGAFRGARLVFIAGAPLAALSGLIEAAKAAGALVNVTDQPQASDFYTPAVVDRGAVVAGIGTTGSAPVLATLLRAELESRWPEGLTHLGRFSARLQTAVRAAAPNLVDRRRVWRDLLLGPAGQAAMQGDMPRADDLALTALEGGVSSSGRVVRFEVPAQADDVTLGLLRALGDADCIVAPEGVPSAVLDYARRDARRVAWASESEIADWVVQGLVVTVLDPQ